MLEIRGRPCIYERKGKDTLIWLLTQDHRWEQLYILVNSRADFLVGAWDWGGGRLFAVFRTSGACLYNLHEVAVEEEEGGGRLTAVSSVAMKYERPEIFTYTWLGNPTNLLGYHPTLISPASIFGDDAFSRRPGRCAAPTQELDEMFLEMTKKLILDPAIQMLSSNL
jgi:hypothetical protein